MGACGTNPLLLKKAGVCLRDQVAGLHQECVWEHILINCAYLSVFSSRYWMKTHFPHARGSGQTLAQKFGFSKVGNKNVPYT